jgi:excisionase family DNA binding protein
MTSIPFRDRISCTVDEACDATGLGRTTIYRLIMLKRLLTKKVGRRTLISVPSLLAAIEN